MKFVALALLVLVPSPSRAERLIHHEVRLDAEGKLLSWIPDAAPYARVMTLAWEALKRVPVGSNGLKTYFSYPRFEAAPDKVFAGVWWAHNPAGLAAMMADSAIGYYAYSGDRDVIELAREMLDYHLAHGMTPLGWDWSGVPYASSNPGATEYDGADDRLFCDGKPCGRGDGVGILEPDKVAELALAYLRFHEISGSENYLKTAIRCADNLARHVREGDETRSPWPFRVDARTGSNVREEYSANVVAALKLFGELERLGLGDTAAYARARETAWSWLLRVPITNDNWSGYFEDIPIHESPDENPNQYNAVETAKYLIAHPSLDPQWLRHAAHIRDWVVEVFAQDVTNRFGVEPGLQHGAEVISEQRDDMAKMGSHTARYASLNALLFQKTGDRDARERALRSFHWATYACDPRGVVKVGTNDDEGYWFSDGYGDYMRHFLVGLGAIPEWAPAREDHIVHSTSLVKSVSYEPRRVSYRVVDGDSTETLRVSGRPAEIQAGGRVLSRRPHLLGSREGFTQIAAEGGGTILRIRHRGGEVVLKLAP